MGACFNSFALAAKHNETSVREIFTDRQEQDRYENGHSYSGGIGMANGIRFALGPIFETEETSEEWLLDNCQKGNAAIAVKFKAEQNDGFDWRWMIGAWCAS